MVEKLREFESDRGGNRFVPLTESRILGMPVIELRMLWRRYKFVSEFGINKRVLDIGSGQSLAWEYLVNSPMWLISTDLSLQNLTLASSAGARRQLNCAAESMPFTGDCFEVISALEMIYYLENPSSFLIECNRVLRKGGLLLMTMPNPDRTGFHKSPHSTNYLNVIECQNLLRSTGFSSEVFGVFRINKNLRNRFLLRCFAVAEKINIVPNSLKGRARIKRLVQGKLKTYNRMEEIESLIEQSDLEMVPLSGRTKDFSVLYVIGTKIS